MNQNADKQCHFSEESAELSHQEAMFDKVNERYLKSIRLSGIYLISQLEGQLSGHDYRVSLPTGVYNYLEFPVKLAAIKLTGIVQPHILVYIT